MNAGERGFAPPFSAVALACWKGVWILELEAFASTSSVFFLGNELRTIIEKIPRPKERINLDELFRLHQLHLMQDQSCLEVPASSFPNWKEYGRPLPPGGHSPLDWAGGGARVTPGCSPDNKDPLISFLHNERAFGFTRSGFSSLYFSILVPPPRPHPFHPLNGLRIVSYLPKRGLESFCWPIT